MREVRFAAFLLFAAGACGACADSTGGAGEDPPNTGDAAGDAAGDASPEAPAPVFCEGEVAHVWDPAAKRALFDAFPDDVLTAEAPTETGLRVAIDEENAPWLADLDPAVASVYDDLGKLDGFGTAAGVVLRFTGDPGPLDGEAVAIWEISGGEAVRVPVSVETAHGGATAILWPERPLRPATRHAAVLTTAHEVPGGGCVSPGATLRSVLDGSATDEALARLVPRHAEALAAIGIGAGDVSAMVVFTTQSTTHDSEVVAADVASRTYTWSGPVSCGSGNGLYRSCEGVFEGDDYRDVGHRRIAEKPVASWTVEVGIWLPDGPAGPYPVVLFGHGLGGDRSQGKYAAQMLASLGVAIVAIDAPWHGAHPTALEDPDAAAGLGAAKLLGLDLGSATFDGLAFRDGFRQATYDKLQVLRLLELGPDLDQDGVDDLDPERLAYFGLSLGGIMGTETLALHGGFDLAVLSVAGGRLVSVITEGQNFAFFKLVLESFFDDPDDLRAVAPVFQTLMDAGDGINHAARVLALPSPPSLLFDMAVADEIVPNVANLALARALGLPVLAPAPVDPSPLEVVPGPVSGNVAGGAATAALFQLDRVTFNGADLQPAGHNACTFTDQGYLQVAHFFETWLESGLPEILDPYELLGTPPL